MATKNVKYPISCYIAESVVYQNKSDKLLKAKIIGIQAYKNFDLSFQILIDEKYLYSNISIYDIIHRNDFNTYEQITELPYIKCVDYSIDVYDIDYLTGRIVQYFVLNKRFQGVYLTTIDFYKDNEQLHLIKSDNGFFVFVPNHKIIVSEDKFIQLPKFKKI